ncbi:hypothetical protein M378DRAFT_186769 [Amanita muscaria Koide BX008]|uniref:MARVEL domain-containing protein n=1 Tax=Amanita muscaria (strain Koide BX008) TaxID=946122 RepID=A0A0C2SM93_AMAMK|nr:hypothetical protein M378DRAFT_186769 [Amanita muscaria Koide BX008]
MLIVQQLRVPLYAALILFSFLLFCLCCARLHYTTTELLYYDPIVVELLVTTLLTVPFAGYIIYCIYKRVETKYVSRFREEIAGLAVLWLFWIVGAGEASAIWGVLGVCQSSPCQVVSALIAFSWLGWITLSGILVLETLFVVANKFWMEPLHGRLDPRISGAFP